RPGWGHGTRVAYGSADLSGPGHLDPVEQPTVAEGGADSFLRELFQVVARDPAGDDHFRVIHRHDQVAELRQCTTNEHLPWFGRRQGGKFSHHITPADETPWCGERVLMSTPLGSGRSWPPENGIRL